MKVLTDLFKTIILLKQMAQEIQYSRWSVVIIIFSGILGGISNTVIIAVVSAGLNDSGPKTAGAILIYIALCLGLGLTRFISSGMLLRITHKAIFDLRVRICDQILVTPLRALEQLGSHKLLAVLTGDVSAITNALALLPLLCMNITIILGCLIYLGWLSWKLLLGVIGVLILGIITHQIPVLKALKHFTRSREAVDSLFKHLRAMIEGIKELKLHRRRSAIFLNTLLKPSALSMQKENIAGETIWAATGSWDQTLLFLIIGFIVFGVPGLWGLDRMTLTGYTLTVLYMMGPLEFILSALPRLGQADVSMKKIRELSVSLADSRVSDEPAEHTETEPTWRLLELDGVAHCYEREGEESTFMLGPLNLCFQPGDLVFITGGNGSGKTTLAKLLTGLYTPESGEIRLDTRPVSDINRDDYRQLFSVVFSDFHLFEELLGLDAPGVEPKARDYLAQLHLSHKVKIKDGKLSTVDLSHGQRKRLALLTAYLEDRPIYVFDEWAADQDPHFKDFFYLQILPGLLARGKTVIAITHDDRYYHLAHRIIKLDDGKLRHEASPEIPVSISADTKTTL